MMQIVGLSIYQVETKMHSLGVATMEVILMCINLQVRIETELLR